MEAMTLGRGDGDELGHSLGLAGYELVIGDADDGGHDEQGHQEDTNGDQDDRQAATPGGGGLNGGR